jgi:hypothetical protein
MLRKLLLSAIIILSLINVGQAVEIKENRAAWVCYDWAVWYNSENPEWKIVTISEQRFFYGVSHMVNYQLEGENLIIHDEFYKLDYTIYDYKNSGLYFHFWQNEQTPVRNYKFLRANSP